MITDQFKDTIFETQFKSEQELNDFATKFNLKKQRTHRYNVIEHKEKPWMENLGYARLQLWCKCTGKHDATERRTSAKCGCTFKLFINADNQLKCLVVSEKKAV